MAITKVFYCEHCGKSVRSYKIDKLFLLCRFCDRKIYEKVIEKKNRVYKPKKKPTKKYYYYKPTVKKIIHPKNCKICNKSFIPKPNVAHKQIFCSPYCKNLSYKIAKKKGHLLLCL